VKYPIFYRLINAGVFVRVNAPNSRDVVETEAIGDYSVRHDTFHSERNINRCIDEYDEARSAGTIAPITEPEFLLVFRRANLIRGNAFPVANITVNAQA